MAAGIAERPWEVADPVALWGFYEWRVERAVWMAKEWEYMILKIYVGSESLIERSEEKLNELGGEGWEAISAWADGSLGSHVLLRRQI